MKKIFTCAILSLLFVAPLILSGCSSKEIFKEGNYKLINMQIIRDDTSFEGYAQFEDGEFSNVFCSSMLIDNTVLTVKSSNCILTYYNEETKVKGIYNFKKYVEDTEYPAYKFESFTGYVNDVEISKNTSESELSNYEEAVQYQIVNILQFDNILEKYTSSVQLATINKSLVAHIIMKDQNNNLAFMGILYGC